MAKSPCRNCGSIEYYGMRTVIRDGEALDQCTDCGHKVRKSMPVIGKRNREYQEGHPEDFIQPFNKDGSKNNDFTKVWGEPNYEKNRLKPAKLK